MWRSVLSGIHLVYTSRSVQCLTACQLDELARQASARNQRLGISGVLLYGGRRFLQLLEGDQERVRALYYNRIESDPRHTDCKVLVESPSVERLLPSWSMGRLYLQTSAGVAQYSWDALCMEISKQNPAAIFSRDPAVTCLNQFIRHFGDSVDRVEKSYRYSQTQTSVPSSARSRPLRRSTG